MTHAELIGKTFDGYRLNDIVALGDDEVLYAAERIRDGDRVWIRTPRSTDTATRARFSLRYDAELTASERLKSVDAVLPVRETISVNAGPGLVTDVPRGRALHDLFAEQTAPWPLKEVMPWFARLVGAMEAAHLEKAGHGSLQPRAVWLDDARRVTVCGVATMAPEPLVETCRNDVRALAALLYRATTGRAPVAGVADTGMPPGPETYVPDYPSSLGRFLRRRFASDVDEPVENAGVFRRSLKALEVDPAYCRAVGIEPRPDDVASERPEAPRVPERTWRLLAWTMFAAAGFVAIAVVSTVLMMNVRIESAYDSGFAAGRDSAPVRKSGADDAGPRVPRLDAWACVHRAFLPGGPGAVRGGELADCLRLAPDVSLSTLADEAQAVALAFADVAHAPRGDSGEVYRKLFAEGPDQSSRT